MHNKGKNVFNSYRIVHQGSPLKVQGVRSGRDRKKAMATPNSGVWDFKETFQEIDNQLQSDKYENDIVNSDSISYYINKSFHSPSKGDASFMQRRRS